MKASDVTSGMVIVGEQDEVLNVFHPYQVSRVEKVPDAEVKIYMSGVCPHTKNRSIARTLGKDDFILPWNEVPAYNYCTKAQ